MDFLPGIAAGTTGVIIGHPFDAVKVRMQTNMYKNNFECVKSIIRNEGLKGFYKGALPALISQNLKRSIQYNVYEKILKRTDNPFLSGFMVSCIGPIIGCPASVIKIGLQTKHDEYLSHYIKKIYNTKGLRGFYKGLPIYTMKEMVHGTTYLGIYGTLRKKYGVNPLSTFLSGCVASTITWSLLFPVDMLKTTIQSHNVKNIEHFRSIINSGYYLKLWRGLPPALLKIAPVNGCIMISYEAIRYLIDSNN